MRKLYKVKATFEYVIVAEDSFKMDTASKYIKDALYDMSVYDVYYKIEPYKEGSVDGWDDSCLPYGDNQNITTGDWLKEQANEQ